MFPTFFFVFSWCVNWVTPWLIRYMRDPARSWEQKNPDHQVQGVSPVPCRFVFDWGVFADMLLLSVSCCCSFYFLARFQTFDYFICNIANFVITFSTRQEKEAWIKSKYVEKRFLKKMSGSEALVEGERKSRPWTVKKCQRHSSSVRAPNKARRKYHRYEPGSASPANLSAGQCENLLPIRCLKADPENHAQSNLHTHLANLY